MVFAGEIAEYRPEWAQAVDVIVSRAFGGADEVTLVHGLRAAGDVAVELVALEDGTPVGHVLFSRLAIEPDTIRVAALAPVAVAPSRQQAGIGGALIRDGLAHCAAAGFDAVAVLGDPAYYRRFGFTRRTAFVLESAYSGPAFQALELRGRVLTGGRWRLTYPRAFAAVD